MTEPGDAAPPARTCPWCSAPAAAGDTTCKACGAALAQREDLGGVLIPGVTGLAPGLEAIRDQPTHIKGPSPSQGVATGIIPAAALGGPAGLAMLGGIAAVTAVEYLSAKGAKGEHVDPSAVGELSGVAQLALEKAQRDEAAGASGAADPASGAAADATEPPAEPNLAIPGVTFVDPIAAAEAASSDRDLNRWTGRDRVIQAAIEDLTGTDDPYHQ
ncbi:MAG TPA: hypothetical protein VF484_00010 [Candidatus Limnocylindrales bacterium]